MRYIVLTAFILLQMVPAHVYAGTEEGAAPVYAGTEEGYAQQDSTAVIPADTTTVAKTKKHPWLAGMEIVGFNVALIGFNRLFYKDDDWSHITMEDIKHNITHKYWVWDQDDVGMNAFRHPAHGSLFYLIARANGMSVGESSLYTLGGTWMWEIFCEAQEPSINDMVYTAVGGITIGETLWRSGKCLVDMIKKGRKWRPSSPFTTSLTLGYRGFDSHNNPSVRTAFATWEATYGDLFDENRRGPFDYFDISGTLVVGQTQQIVSDTRIDQQLWSHPITDKPLKKIVMGLYNHFDYFCAVPYWEMPKAERNKRPYSYSEVGAIGPGIAYRLGKRVNWEQQLYVNGIMMGATPCDLYHSESKGYSFGSGYGARLYSTLSVGNWLRVGVRAQCSHLFTWDGFYDDDKSRTRDGEASIQGETGNALTAIIAPSIEWRPLKHFALVGNGKFMHTHLNYKYHPHASTHAWEWQVGVRYVIR